MPPAWAMAMASLCSVTVYPMAAETSGTPRRIDRVSRVLVSASARQDGRPARLQQDIVEGQRLGDGRDRRGGGDGHAVRACALCKIETIAGRMADADCPTCLTTNPQPRKAACGAGRESRGQPLLTMPAVSATAFSRSALR